jgi:hypothetical protein
MAEDQFRQPTGNHKKRTRTPPLTLPDGMRFEQVVAKMLGTPPPAETQAKKAARKERAKRRNQVKVDT